MTTLSRPRCPHCGGRFLATETLDGCLEVYCVSCGWRSIPAELLGQHDKQPRRRPQPRLGAR